MEFTQRPIAITDLETTGFDADMNEILEIGLILVKPNSLEILDEFETKVIPNHIETAAPKALEFLDYKEKDWLEAITLAEAIRVYSEKTRNAIFLAHNSYTDWSFMAEAFKRTGVEDYMDYHRLDLFSIAWSKKEKMPGLKEFRLSALCDYLGIEKESFPHRAMNGARKNLEVLKMLVKL